MRQRLYFFVFFLCLSVSLRADFFAKIPEFNPGDSKPGYDLYQPPWYPYDVEEARIYTVNEVGELVKRPKEDQGLLNYGKKTTKAEEIAYELKKISEKLIFEKVIASPRVVVQDFYTHVDLLSFDLSALSFTETVRSPQGVLLFAGSEILASNTPEFGGFPPIPGDFRIVYDTWTLGVLKGWNYSFYKIASTPRGLLVPNLREFALYLTGEGVASIKHAAVLLERNNNKLRFSPGHSALKAISGLDFKRNLGQWQKEYIQPTWSQKEKPSEEDYSNWKSCVRSLVMKDITSKRVPARRAFLRVRDIPELSEPIFLELIEKETASLIVKRNLASLLSGFSAPHVAQALHKLARDPDTVTAIRAVESLADHPHGKVKQILLDWLDPKVDDIRRAKSILMMGRSGSAELGQKLIEFLPQAQDDMERELVLRSLMRLRHIPALKLFKKHEKSSFETLAYTSRLGRLVLGDLKEDEAIKIIDKAFRREDALPGSSKIVSFASEFRFDLVKWMAHTDMKKPRRRLWKYIQDFKDLGAGSEVGGVAHLLAYGLYEIELGDEVISRKEASKILNFSVFRSSIDIQLRVAALSRLYELDEKKCLKACHQIIRRFLNGRKVSENADNAFTVSERDFLVAAVNLVLLDDPDQDDLIEKIMVSPNMSGQAKSLLLENLFNIKKKLALSVIKDNLRFYTARSSLNSDDERYLVRLLRFAGMLKNPKVLQGIIRLIEKSSDEWLRFVAMYSLRLALDSKDYGNVITGTAQERAQLTEKFRGSLKEVNKK